MIFPDHLYPHGADSLRIVYNNEEEVGHAIKESKVERSKLYVTTKVYKNMKEIRSSLKESLKKLQLDHVDL